MLTLSHVSHSFGPSWALRNVSLSLQKGEFLFLCGPSGAGKTTLLRLLYGDLPLQHGAASVAGFNIKSLGKKLPLLRRQVSVIFQDFKILPERSVQDNVALALQVRGLSGQHVQRRVRAAVRTLGLESKLTTPCRQLSGGEQQRVAVARAIVVNPQVILADEPTGNLDPTLSMRLMDIFMQFNAHGATVVLATHNPDLLRRLPSARMIRLEDGCMTAANWPGADAPAAAGINDFIPPPPFAEQNDEADGGRNPDISSAFHLPSAPALDEDPFGLAANDMEHAERVGSGTVPGEKTGPDTPAGPVWNAAPGQTAPLPPAGRDTPPDPHIGRILPPRGFPLTPAERWRRR